MYIMIQFYEVISNYLKDAYLHVRECNICVHVFTCVCVNKYIQLLHILN